jgi:hypothetical protein
MRQEDGWTGEVIDHVRFWVLGFGVNENVVKWGKRAIREKF